MPLILVLFPSSCLFSASLRENALAFSHSERGDERCLLPKGAQFVVQWRYGDKERESLCVRHKVPPGVGTEVAEVDTAERDRTEELFSEIAEYHGFEIEEMEVAADHVHVSISFPPKYSRFLTVELR
jgi:hypothetical protein